MKRSRKLLSMLLVVVMVFSAVAIPASAAIPSTVTSLDQLVQPAGLGGLVDWLIGSLNTRKENIIDSVLKFVCAYVEDINAYVKPAGANLFDGSVSAEQKATALLDYLDNEVLKDLSFDPNSTVGKVLDAVNGLGIDVKFNSVNGILETLNTVNGAKVLISGDVANLNLDSVVVSGLLGTSSAQSRAKTGDLQIIYNLISFLNDNRAIIGKFFTKSLDLGIADGLAGDKVDEYSTKLTELVEDLVYEKLVRKDGEPEKLADSMFKDWTVDEMLISALVRMIGREGKDKAEVDEFLNTSLYNLLTSYGDKLYDEYLLTMLTGEDGLVKKLDNWVASIPGLQVYFKQGAAFTASEFNFAGAENGILGEFNNVLVALLNKLLADDVLAELKLENGDNSKLNANLEKVVKFVLPKLCEFVDPADADFSKYTAEYVADKTLSELAVEILKMFFPGWFHLEDSEADLAIVEQLDTMAEVAAFAVYYTLVDFNDAMMDWDGYDFAAEWKGMLLEADGATVKDLGASYWGDICLSMAADAAMYGLAAKSDDFYFNFNLDAFKAAKQAGWTAEELLDEIVDWALGMVKGLPAVADNLTFVRGKLDGNGPFYKLNVLLNEILDWNFLSNCSNGIFTLDIETLLFDGLLGNVYDFDLESILGLFAVNAKEGNLLNQNTVTTLLSVVDNLLSVLFEHKGGSATATVAATCEDGGFTVKYCDKCGLYSSVSNETAATGHKKTPETLKAATCTEQGLVRYTCENCDWVSREQTDFAAHQHKMTPFTGEDGKLYYGNICSECGDIEGEPQLVPGQDPEPVLAAIEIVTAPTKLEYVLNSEETLDLAGIVVKAVYDDESSAEIAVEDIVVKTGLDISKEGEQTIEIAYLEKTATFTVTVIIPRAKGDVDGKDGITAADARLALRASVGLETLDEESATAADVDGKDGITAADARLILRASVGLEEIA